MAGLIGILPDIANETLTLKLVDGNGAPTGTLPPGVTVTWAIQSDPNPTPSVLLTPSADTTSCQVKAAPAMTTPKGGPYVMVEATATLPPSTTPETDTVSLEVDATAAVGLQIQLGTPIAN